MTRVSEIMTPDVKTLREDQCLLDAMVFMRDEKVRHLPVVDAAGALAGLVTDRDIKRATPSVLLKDQREAFEATIRETPLARIMSRTVITVSSGDDLKSVVQTFVEEKIGCLPVVDDGKLAGILTATDLLRALLKRLD